jgi:hypothetical protein
MARNVASCSVSCASYFAASRKVLHKNRLQQNKADICRKSPEKSASFGAADKILLKFS